jgi:hypothetical protein
MRAVKNDVRLGIVVVILILLAAACSPSATEPDVAATEPAGNGMEGMDNNMGVDSSQATQQYAPLVRGLYEGDEVLFIHTEASDADVTAMLTEMMGGPEVVLVTALADAPPSLLAQVYVFTNGIPGHGPFGFQADIFDAVPGEEAYRPLRNVNLVSWNEQATPAELRSAAEVQEAETAGEVTITQPDIVVNMPILVWPGGSR